MALRESDQETINRAFEIAALVKTEDIRNYLISGGHLKSGESNDMVYPVAFAVAANLLHTVASIAERQSS